MKKTLLFSILFFGLAMATNAQARYAIIDTRYILNKIPEYREADKKLALIGEQWQKEIDDKQASIDKMYKNYEAEQFMLTDELKKKREDELFVREKEIRELQKRRFGYEGDLFKERQKMVKPIQDKVFNAVQKIAIAKAYDFVLDKSEGITIIFADPKLDKSEEVLKELGIKN
ncbi:MAG: OmpH family outer membrane protein [Chitinophagaceae bacterium]|nr:OmpH family outer membrane protein [Chitinophagaceae bacterium]MDP1762329.1 OmpH family outer membrane protein [Sediminibacterium sp.]MDP1810693.1 OmpH family outer membrane protein [Sediminibacterium sp.]MDP3129358.1 OmpH family outer membrane protein [Sediminibacterium sp.]MDP3666481.1 OmpH family outer membrane protein [Sediminibacterium sp.]